MSKYEKLIEWARSQIGYKEGKNNDNKYGREYGLNNQPWCLIFTWIAHKVVGVLLPKIASCKDMGDWYLKNRPECILKKPVPGCFILYSWGHAGIFLADNGDGTMTTIEGNTSFGVKGSQTNGDGVYLRTDREFSGVRLFIDGINERKGDDYMTETEILNELGDRKIHTFSELPEWAKPDMRELLDQGIINGGTSDDPDDINMLLSDIRNVIVSKRMVDAAVKNINLSRQ